MELIMALPLFFAMNMDELSKWISERSGDELAMNITDAVAKAKQDTLAEIQRLHPKRVRGQALKKNWVFVGKSDKYSRITYQSGKGVVIPVMFYSDFFARWEITGAYGRMIKKGKRKGQYGPKYPSKSDFYQQNIQFLNEFLANRIKEYLTDDWRR